MTRKSVRMDLPDFSPYTLAELGTLINAAAAALESKKTITSAKGKIDHILAEVKQAQGFQPGDAWVQPNGAHDAYPVGVHVTYAGKVWENLTTGNVWAPGVSGWREYVEPGSVAAWVQPTGSQGVYNVGDRVTHSGKVWRCTTAANVWEPSVGGWEAVVTP